MVSVNGRGLGVGAPEVHGIPLPALSDHLSQIFGAEIQITGVHDLAGGCSHRSTVLTCRIGAHGEPLRLVLRSLPDNALPGGLSVQAEQQVLQVLWNAGTAVPRPYGVISCNLHIPKTIAVLGFIDGDFAPQNTGPAFLRSDDGLIRQLVREIIKIHSFKYSDANLTQLGRLVDRWDLMRGFEFFLVNTSEFSASDRRRLQQLSAAMQRDLSRIEDKLVLCHNDIRLGNLAIHQDNLNGIIDFEFSTYNIALCDITYFLAPKWWLYSWSDISDWHRFCGTFLNLYQDMAKTRFSRVEIDFSTVYSNLRLLWINSQRRAVLSVNTDSDDLNDLREEDAQCIDLITSILAP